MRILSLQQGLRSRVSGFLGPKREGSPLIHDDDPVTPWYEQAKELVDQYALAKWTLGEMGVDPAKVMK